MLGILFSPCKMSVLGFQGLIILHLSLVRSFLKFECLCLKHQQNTSLCHCRSKLLLMSIWQPVCHPELSFQLSGATYIGADFLYQWSWMVRQKLRLENEYRPIPFPLTHFPILLSFSVDPHHLDYFWVSEFSKWFEVLFSRDCPIMSACSLIVGEWVTESEGFVWPIQVTKKSDNKIIIPIRFNASGFAHVMNISI